MFDGELRRLEAAVRRCLKIEAQAKNVALSEENRPRKLSAGKTPLGEPLLQEQVWHGLPVNEIGKQRSYR